MNNMMNTLKMFSTQLKKNGDRNHNKVRKQMIDQMEKIQCIRDDKIFLKSFTEIMFSRHHFFPNIREKYIINSLFPKEPKYMDKGPILRGNKDFYTELRWMVFLCGIYSDVISSFVDCRKKFDACVLLGNYKEALEILEKAEMEFGVSFWLLESKLFIYSKMGINTAKIFEDWPKCNSKIIVRRNICTY